jgi:putative polyhydroxyalkanoate system protein
VGKKISVTRKHSLGVDVASQKLNELAGQFAEKYGVKATIRGPRAEFSGRGVEGNLQITADSVTVNLELGLLLGALSGKIEDGVQRQLEKHFA